MDAIKSGEEVRQYVRIQVIGKDRVGKTSLVHRLLFLDEGKYDGKSTDGININRKCQIRTSDGEWIVADVDREKEMIKRILQTVNRKQKGKEPVFDLPLTLPSDKHIFETEQKQNGHESIKLKEHDEVPKLNDETQFTNNTKAASKNNSDDNNLNKVNNMEKHQNSDPNNHEEMSDNLALSVENQLSFSEEIDQITEKIIEKMDDIILDAKTEKDKMTLEGLIECGIWDFAGQKDYYATHQTFFTPHAIYLLIADINEDLKAMKHDEEFDFNSIGDYIDFWFDSIHCFCKDLSAVELCPPVIMICTGTDRIKQDVDQKSEYNETFCKIFGGQRKADHRRGIYFISNTNFLEEDIKEVKRLRKHISEIAKQMNHFAETLPTRWIQLEHALRV
ncbi:unnamed protein product [Mytilus coruscus]|uniref:Uncharacterized protein n=1 Tax=Mytilus coruscus TaxID=42192 RepID=A0A6J8E1V3_MYTCO|nr:unnamed protein product [Mytilus coruscus]